MITSNLFKNILPQQKRYFNVQEYKDTFPELTTVTNNRMFDCIEHTFRFFFGGAHAGNMMAFDTKNVFYIQMLDLAKTFIANNCQRTIAGNPFTVLNSINATLCPNANSRVEALATTVYTKMCEIYYKYLKYGALVSTGIEDSDVSHYTRGIMSVQ